MYFNEYIKKAEIVNIIQEKLEFVFQRCFLMW